MDHTSKHRLALACLRTFFPESIAVFIPRMAFVGVMLAQPFLVKATLQYLASPDKHESHGYGLIGAYALCYVGIAVSRLEIMYLDKAHIWPRYRAAST